MNFFQVKRSGNGRRGNKINPLMLPSIIHRTFGYLNVSNLLTCRKVNKLWREESTRRLQGVIIVKLDDWHSIEQFNIMISTHVKVFPYSMFTGVELGQQLCLGDRSVQVALKKLAPLIKNVVMSAKVGPIEWRWLLFDTFSNITELRIEGHVPFQPIISAPVPEMTDYRLNTTPGCFLIIATASPSSLQPTSSPQFPQKSAVSSSSQFQTKELVNLVKLSFNLKNRRSEDIFVRRFLRDIFSVVPNLKMVEWIKEDSFANDFQKTMFDCLMMKIRPENEGKLEAFICPSLVCGTKELQDISRRMFPLKKLQIQISSDVPAQYLENFIEALGDTLQILKLEFSPGTPINLTVGNPVSNLINLKEVALTEYKRSIGFVGYLPSLKKLTLTRTNIKRALLSIGWSFDNKEQTELSKSLEQLFIFNGYLSRDHGNCTREIVLKLAHCFPNMKAIRLEGLDDSSLRHLFKSFNHLEEVYAPGGTYSDEAFRSYTGGKDSSICSNSRSPNRYVLSAFDAAHLKNLRTLELESIGLTDKFITQGIINWRSIRNLTVKYCRISYPTLSRVMMEMDLQRMCLQYCTIPTEGIIGAHNDPIEMMQDDEALILPYDQIQKWRFETFKLLFDPDQ